VLRFAVAVLLALAALLLGGCSASVQTAGYVAADARVFAQTEKYAGQARGDGVSLVAEPEITAKTESGSHTATLRPFYRLDPIDEKRSHADLRQASYRAATEHFEASLGIGSVTWGVLESYRPSDIVNQLDFVEGIDKDAKLGQPFVEAGWLGDKASLKLYALPWFRDRTFQGLRGRPRLGALVDTVRPIFETDARRWQPSGAMRFAWQGGDVDLGLGLFSGISREPRFVAELTTGQVVPAYDLAHQASADAQWTVGAGFVLKAEGFFRLWSKELRAFGGGGAGLDYTWSKPFGEADLTFAAEFLFDTRPLTAAPTFFQRDAFLGARLGFGDAAGTELTAGAIVDVTDGTTFGRLGASRRFGEHVRASILVNAFLAPGGKLESSFVRDDNALARLAYFF
jgi:hypothetical protein